MVLMLDEAAGRLYTVASTGYPRSGIGSEIALGEGVIGVAARERAPIRIGHMTADYAYGAAIRARGGTGATEIPYPGLARAREPDRGAGGVGRAAPRRALRREPRSRCASATRRRTRSRSSPTGSAA